MGVIAEMGDDVVVMYLGRVVERGPVDEIFHAPAAPLHPGAAALDPERAGDAARAPATIEGSIPHPYNRPPGCPFHPRCPDAIAGLCERAMPPLTALGAAARGELLSLRSERSAATAPAPSLLEPAG